MCNFSSPITQLCFILDLSLDQRKMSVMLYKVLLPSIFICNLTWYKHNFLKTMKVVLNSQVEWGEESNRILDQSVLL